MGYFDKLEQNPYKDLEWNIPEQKRGTINVIGGNKQGFRTEVKVAEFLTSAYPLQEVRLIVPDTLRGKLPELPNIQFLPSTESGAFAESQELDKACSEGDYALLLGDLSKNNVTGRAIAGACGFAKHHLMITRDAIDLISENTPERVLMNDNITIMASIVQLRKLLQAVYYPKILLASQSLIQIADILHKFTLSYPVMIVTFHNDQVIVAENGNVKAVAIDDTGYTSLSLWMGEAAGRIAAMSLYNPGSRIKAAIAGIWQQD